MNSYQKALMNTYHRFINIWIKKYGYNEIHSYYLGYNYLSYYTNLTMINWTILEDLKEITDKNNTSWEVLIENEQLTIKFEK